MDYMELIKDFGFPVVVTLILLKQNKELSENFKSLFEGMQKSSQEQNERFIQSIDRNTEALHLLEKEVDEHVA